LLKLNIPQHLIKIVHTLQHLTIIEAPNFLLSDILRPHHIWWEQWFIFLKNSTIIEDYIIVGSMVSHFTFI
jgi:hypothetical protein